jgi:hypothetical protein
MLLDHLVKRFGIDRFGEVIIHIRLQAALMVIRQRKRGKR